MLIEDEMMRSVDAWMEHIQNEMHRCMNSFMEERNYNQSEASQATGISMSDMRMILNGEFSGSMQDAIRIMISIGKAPRFSFVSFEEAKHLRSSTPKMLSAKDVESLKAVVEDNNESIVSDSLWLAYDMEPKVDNARLHQRRRHQQEAEDVLKKLIKPYVPLMERKGRSGPYFQMQDVLLACGELNKRERVAISWLLKKANEMHEAYEKERQP